MSVNDQVQGEKFSGAATGTMSPTPVTPATKSVEEQAEGPKVNANEAEGRMTEEIPSHDPRLSGCA